MSPRTVTIRGPVVALAATISALGLAPVASAQPAPQPAAPVGDPTREAEWILLAQGTDGAIASHADHAFVNPHLASFAIGGLAAAARVTGNPRYGEASWRAVEWYAANMDLRGFVRDNRVTASGLVSTGDADSTDAYSGMFLSAVEAAQAAAPNAARLGALTPDVRAAVDAIRATQRGDWGASILSQFLLTHSNALDPNAIDLVAGTRSAAAATGLAWPSLVQIAGDVIRLATGA